MRYFVDACCRTHRIHGPIKNIKFISIAAARAWTSSSTSFLLWTLQVLSLSSSKDVHWDNVQFYYVETCKQLNYSMTMHHGASWDTAILYARWHSIHHCIERAPYSPVFKSAIHLAHYCYETTFACVMVLCLTILVYVQTYAWMHTYVYTCSYKDRCKPSGNIIQWEMQENKFQ